MNAIVAVAEKPLQVFAPAQLKQELTLPEDLTPAEDKELRAKAEEAVKQLLEIDPSDLEEKNSGVAAVETMAADLQKMSGRRSNMLQQTIGTLARTGEDGGPVANSLVDLQNKVEELDPNKFDFSSNWVRRALGSLPFVGTPISQYFARYQSAESVISNIVASLEKGRDQLKRDIITLEDDQKHLHQLAEALRKVIAYAQMVDKVLSEKLDNELTADDPRTAFIKEEIQFPLRQRIMDLQQQLVVTQQGVLTLEVIKRNNKELIRGVTRALGVTINALQIAVTLALALANQRIVLEKVEAVNKTTDQLIAENAAKLRTQGVEIHKQAASAQLSMEVLKQAFADITAAIDDIARFRQEALPTMAKSILEMDSMTAQAAESIHKMDEAKKVEKHYGLEILEITDDK
ncbi:MAG TPA: toxic anion resistance protein [Methylococcaceae bacterium]|nr:toxic anion resistance protein [Methylococcaceae bacterium]